MIHRGAKQIAKWYIRQASYKAKQRILVIESDDWGSRRTDSPLIKNQLNMISKHVREDWYTQLDNLATSDDLNHLSDTFKSVESNHNTPVLTANFCMANPDFTKIKESNFKQFYFETFSSTLRQVHGEGVEDTWKKIIKNKVVKPQLHGREHLHALAWMKELRKGNSELREAFDLNSWGIPYIAQGKQRRKNCQAALDHYGIDGEINFQRTWISESAELFRKHFGFDSSTFIAPTYVWHPDINSTIAESGIQAYQGIQFQDIPLSAGSRLYKRKLNILGSRTQEGIWFLVRNAFFEPSSNPGYDWKNHCLDGIFKAFKYNMPAIIGSHRVNYIGSLNEQNRERNLKQLKEILQTVVRKYPDVRFMSSDELLSTMLSKK